MGEFTLAHQDWQPDHHSRSRAEASSPGSLHPLVRRGSSLLENLTPNHKGSNPDWNASKCPQQGRYRKSHRRISIPGVPEQCDESHHDSYNPKSSGNATLQNERRALHTKPIMMLRQKSGRKKRTEPRDKSKRQTAVMDKLESAIHDGERQN
jgi:hypothetical protein